MSSRLNNDKWQTAQTHNSHIWFDKSLISKVEQNWFHPEHWQKLGAVTGESKGRYTTYFVRTEGVNNQAVDMVLRHYYRGGLISKLSKRSFIFTGLHKARAYQELLMLSQMRELELPVPRPIAAQVIKNKPWSCQNDILIELIDGAQDLFHFLTKQELTDTLWQQVGKTIKQFHQHGVFHSDLNIHNILMDQNEKIWLIDFDRCHFKSPDSSWQQANLDRLLRSLNKEKTLNPDFHFNQANWQQLLAGYQS